MAYSFDPQVRDAIVRIARNHGVDPMAALAVAMGEGGVKFGAVGDNNTSFGPFQLHVGGALPQGKDAAWANSIDGIRYAIRTMAGAGAKGLKGLDAINAIVRQFERPAAPDASVQNAWKRYQDPAFRQTLMDAVGPLPGQTPQMPGVPQTPAAQPQQNDATRQAALASIQRIASGEKYNPVAALNETVAFRQRTQQMPDTQSPAAAALSVAGTPATDPVTGYALDQLGTPYSWGGGTPSGPSEGFAQGAGIVGFDCSSLVQAAWAKAGVKLPRTTYDQIKVGQAVDPGKPGSWRAGDLLFPHPGHVMMYLGDGKAVEAPYTGGVVRVVDVGSRSKYVAVRRPGQPQQ